MRRVLVLLAAAAAALGLLGSAEGAFPGSNGLIAYGCSGNAVCTVNADGSNGGVLLTNASDPVYSPNAQKIAFTRGIPSTIYTANADGSNQAQRETDGAAQPTWSSDNTTLAYIKNGDIYIDTGSAVSPLTNDGTAADPAFSPNGQKIAYTDIGTDGNSHIFVKTVAAGAAGAATQLTSNATWSNDDASPAWSPDGAYIVFESTAGGIWRVASAGGTPVQIVTDPPGTFNGAADPAYSPDGTKIVYASQAGQLWVAPSAPASTGAQIVASTANAQTPDWGSATVSGSAGGSTSPPTSPGLPADTPGSGPKNTSYPVITLASGDSSPVVGHAMFASTGTWTGTFPITYAYQWKRCDPNDPVNGTCAAIPGANSSTYTPVPQDSGWRIRVAVQASNSDGRTTQNSEVTAVTVTLAPRATATPPITPGGTNQVDQPLSVATGTWAGSTPIAYTYSWRRCDPVGDLDSCVPIQGATSSSYTPTVADIGFSLRVWITGSNTAGSDTAITNHTFPIVDKPHFAPTATTQPTIAGVALPGRQLTADIGAYSGDAPIATPFQWFRCDAIGDNCHEIPGATKVVYFPGAADVGYTLRIYVFASNTYGKLVAKSEPTDAVAANPPHVRGKRIVGTNKADYLAGTGHDDVIIGLAGNDTITGGAGDDKLYGGPGNDVITGGAGADQIFGGRGSDTIHAADGERDVVDCGPGNDHAIVDKVDVVSNCEVVTVIP